jgi:hypothetical protein
LGFASATGRDDASPTVNDYTTVSANVNQKELNQE